MKGEERTGAKSPVEPSTGSEDCIAGNTIIASSAIVSYDAVKPRNVGCFASTTSTRARGIAISAISRWPGILESSPLESTSLTEVDTSILFLSLAYCRIALSC
jgi:hypothetical protein